MSSGRTGYRRCRSCGSVRRPWPGRVGPERHATELLRQADVELFDERARRTIELFETTSNRGLEAGSLMPPEIRVPLDSASVTAAREPLCDESIRVEYMLTRGSADEASSARTTRSAARTDRIGRQRAKDRQCIERFACAMLSGQCHRSGEIELVAVGRRNQQRRQHLVGARGATAAGHYARHLAEIRRRLAEAFAIRRQCVQCRGVVAAPRFRACQFQPHVGGLWPFGQILPVFADCVVGVTSPGADAGVVQGHVQPERLEAGELAIAVPRAIVVCGPCRQCGAGAQILGLFRLQREGPLDGRQCGFRLVRHGVGLREARQEWCVRRVGSHRVPQGANLDGDRGVRRALAVPGGHRKQRHHDSSSEMPKVHLRQLLFRVIQRSVTNRPIVITSVPMSAYRIGVTAMAFNAYSSRLPFITRASAIVQMIVSAATVIASASQLR